MVTRVLLALAAMLVAASAAGQSGLYVPERSEPGLDPSLAPIWQSPDYSLQRFTTGQRPSWAWSLSERSSLGMSYYSGREVDFDSRQMSLFGRYSFSPSWAFSAETQLRDPGALPRLQDLRIGVQRKF